MEINGGELNSDTDKGILIFGSGRSKEKIMFMQSEVVSESYFNKNKRSVLLEPVVSHINQKKNTPEV